MLGTWLYDFACFSSLLKLVVKGGGGRDESVLRHMRWDFEGITFFR